MKKTGESPAPTLSDCCSAWISLFFFFQINVKRGISVWCNFTASSFADHFRLAIHPVAPPISPAVDTIETLRRRYRRLNNGGHCH